MNSPLGKYAQLAATVCAVGIIATYLLATVLALPSADDLQPVALLAVGAVFGSAATVNGYKRDQVAIQKRMDAAGIPSSPTIDPAPTP